MTRSNPLPIDRRVAAAAVAVAAMLTAACSRDDASGNASTAGAAVAGEQRDIDPAHAVDAAPNKARDAAIAAEVRALLARDADLGARVIDVDAAGGEVVLRGSVPDTATRARAASLVRSVDGVETVNNELSVQPAP